jgi:Fe-S-cluster containining protein
VNIPDLRYDCLHCGYSCQGLEVELSSIEYEALRSLDPQAVTENRDRHWLRKRECGACHFLSAEESGGRCQLHSSYGPQSKPAACREFPFRALATPGGVFLGASFACRAILERHGPPVDVVEAQVRELPPYPLAPGLDMNWPHYQSWERRVARRLEEQGGLGLWTAALELTLEVLQAPAREPKPSLDDDLQASFRGLLALAEGPSDESELLAILQALAQRGAYTSRLLGGPVDVGAVLDSWQEPWSLWPEVEPFFQHLLFRKYLLEGPDVHSRVCSLPIMAQLLEFLVLARAGNRPASLAHAHWAIRTLEERLTFHARGLELYLGRCGQAFLRGLAPA